MIKYVSSKNFPEYLLLPEDTLYLIKAIYICGTFQLLCTAFLFIMHVLTDFFVTNIIKKIKKWGQNPKYKY